MRANGDQLSRQGPPARNDGDYRYFDDSLPCDCYRVSCFQHDVRTIQRDLPAGWAYDFDSPGDDNLYDHQVSRNRDELPGRQGDLGSLHDDDRLPSRRRGQRPERRGQPDHSLHNRQGNDHSTPPGGVILVPCRMQRGRMSSGGVPDCHGRPRGQRQH